MSTDRDQLLDSNGRADSSITLDRGTIDSASGLSQFASDYNVAS